MATALLRLPYIDSENGCCSLDQSESAFGSEDFPGSRWTYQADIAEALAERLYLQQAACEDRAHLIGLHSTNGRQQSLCLLSSSSAKALSPPTSIADRAPVLARLHSMLPCCSPLTDIASALKLAVVRPHHDKHIIMS